MDLCNFIELQQKLTSLQTFYFISFYERHFNIHLESCKIILIHINQNLIVIIVFATIRGGGTHDRP